MTKPKKQRGRPARPLPPKIDAPPEAVARVLMQTPPKQVWRYETGGHEYRCVSCFREVNYPETLYDDGNCEDCKEQSSTPSKGR